MWSVSKADCWIRVKSWASLGVAGWSMNVIVVDGGGWYVLHGVWGGVGSGEWWDVMVAVYSYILGKVT